MEGRFLVRGRGLCAVNIKGGLLDWICPLHFPQEVAPTPFRPHVKYSLG